MNRCHITDRKSLGGTGPLLARIALNDAAGIELIQIREKDLTPCELAELVRAAVAACRRARILVNTRVDVALACGAAGAHLPSDSPPPSAWRSVTPPGFLFGVSCHTVEELVQAERDGADYALFAPVFCPLSKEDDRPPHGLDGLRAACAAVTLPVYALGGITAGNSSLCIQAGAAGVAGITLFQS